MYYLILCITGLVLGFACGTIHIQHNFWVALAFCVWMLFVALPVIARLGKP